MTQFRYALGEPVRIAKTGELATVRGQHRTEYTDFYTLSVCRNDEWFQVDLPAEHIRSSAPLNNVIPFSAVARAN